MRRAHLGLALVLTVGTGCFSGLDDQPPVGPPGPSAWRDSASAYDPVRQRLVVQGGRDEGDAVYSSTWEYDGSRWILTDPIGPGPRRLAAMAYFPELKAVVLYGGLDEHSVWSGCSETWTYDGAAWRKLDVVGPGCRRGHGLIYDSAQGRLLLYGGAFDCQDQSCQELWAFDGAAWSLLKGP